MDDVVGKPARHALGETGRQCTATSKTTGERCGRAPILGGFVCDKHGGKIPAVQRTARQRLLAMVDPALDALLRVLQSGNACLHCGRSGDMSLVLRAAQIVLDRTGFHPSLTMEVTPTKEAAWHRYVTDEELTQIAQITARAKQRMLIAQDPEVIDAVLVEEVPTPNRAESAPVGNEPGPGEVDG